MPAAEAAANQIRARSFLFELPPAKGHAMVDLSYTPASLLPLAAAQPGSTAVHPATGATTIIDGVWHDAATANALIVRQMAAAFNHVLSVPVLLAALAVALALAWPVRLWVLARMFALLQRAPVDNRLAVIAKAVGSVVISIVLLAVAGQIVVAACNFALPLLPETAVLLHALAMALGVTGLGLGLGRALQSPEDPAWRPVPLPAGLGAAIGFYPFAAALTLGLTNVIDQTARVLHASQPGWTISQGLVMLVEIGLVARFLLRAGKARSNAIEQAVSHHTGATVPAIFGITALVWAALALACGLWLCGFTRIAMLLLQELLWMGLVLTTAWLLSGLFDALLTQVFDADWTVGRFATAIVGLRRARVKQVALVGSAMLTVIVWLLAIGLVAAPLHGDRAVVVEQIRPTMLLNALRSLNLSPRSMIAAAVVLTVGIALTRLVRNWLETRFLPATALDIGVRTSLVTGLTYTGVLIAILAATSMLGLQLEKITLIASALSVGIGFGLQSIIQNFVSGVIMLIERPVKVGDWIAVSGAEGTIRRIRVRATELATADGGVAIVPNSSFISSNVSNRADALMPCRVDMALTVSGAPTAAAARDALLRLVGQCALIRKEPAPQIHLATLGDSEWTFNLRAYAAPDTALAQARSELLFALSSQATAAGLKIRTT
jgi:small-conductance mechanosensitive channel